MMVANQALQRAVLPVTPLARQAPRQAPAAERQRYAAQTERLESLK